MKRGNLGNDLAVAWTRLGADALAELLARYVDSGWRSRGTYATGPCPLGVGKCRIDERAAYVYPERTGWPPWVRCRHRESCAFSASVFDLLADALGSKRAAVRAVSNAARAEVARLDRAGS